MFSRLLVATLVAVLAASSVALTRAGTAEGKPKCAHYVIADSRGSNEQRDISVPGERVINRFRQLRPAPGWDIRIWANPYPANGGFPTLASAWLKLPQAYHKSVEKGKEELTNFIVSLRNACPTTKIILTGYSQGAHVTGDVYQTLSRGNIIGVALFGDPKFNPRSVGSVITVASPHNINASGALGARPAFGLDAQALLSFCHFGDPVCQGSPATFLATYLALYQLNNHVYDSRYGEPEYAAGYFAQRG